MRYVLAILVSVLCLQRLYAQDDSSRIIPLGTMDVPASPNLEKVRASPGQSLDLEDGVRAATAQGVSEILNETLGFAETMTFQAPLVLRGVSGNRLLILRNGERMGSSYTQGTMVHTVNANELGSIHVEKGLSSVRYGSGAIAGTIDLSTRPFASTTGLHSQFSLGYTTNAHEALAASKAEWTTPQFSLRLFAQGRQAENYRYGGGEQAVNSDFNDNDYSLDAQWQPTLTQSWTYRGSWHRGGPWGKPEGFSGTRYLIVRTPQEDLERHSVQYLYLGRNLLRELPILASYTQERRTHDFVYLDAGSLEKSFQETTFFNYKTLGLRSDPLLRITPQWEIRTGAESFYSVLSSPLDVVDYYEGIQYRNRLRQDASYLSAATFLENEWQFSQNATLRLGARYDRTQLDEGEVHDTSRNEALQSSFGSTSGLVALHAQAGAHQMGVTLARSYRTPAPAEMFGQSITGNGLVFGNPQLSAETGINADAFWNTQGSWGQTQFSPFLWFLHNLISKELQSGKGISYQYLNTGRARIWGGEAQWTSPTRTLPFSHGSLAVGAAYVNARSTSDEPSIWGSGTPLEDTAPLRLQTIFRLNNRSHQRWSNQFYALWDYYPALGHHKLDLSVSLRNSVWAGKPRLDLAMVNVLDRRYTPLLSLLPAKGRDIRTTLTLQI